MGEVAAAAVGMVLQEGGILMIGAEALEENLEEVRTEEALEEEHQHHHLLHHPPHQLL